MAAGRVEQVTAIHRVNIKEFRTGLFNGDRYRQVTVIQSGRYSRFDCISNMIHLSSKKMTQYSVMTSSLRVKNSNIDKFRDIDYNSKTDAFRDVIQLIINQCEPTLRRIQSVRQRHSASKRSALVVYMTGKLATNGSVLTLAPL